MSIRLHLVFLASLWAVPGWADVDLPGLTAACDACHGPDGRSEDPEVPIIAGQSAALIEKAHEQFRDMGRPCRKMAVPAGAGDPAPTTMCEVSAALDRAAIEAVTAHYASLPFVPADQPFDSSRALQGAMLHQLYCESCHPEGGSKAGFAGRLAGQWKPYLRRAMEQIVTGEIQVPHIMERKLADFSRDESEALLDYWSSQAQ